MERGIDILVKISLLVIGFSHVLQPRAWVEFFTMLREKGHAGVLAVAMLHLPIALLIVAFHPSWRGVPAIVTFLGYAWTLKATLYFTFPRVGLRSLGFVSVERAWHFVIGGWLLIGLGAVMSYSLVSR
jgi:hypothetical protein